MVFKRKGKKVYEYDFEFKGQRYNGSTRLRNRVKAKMFETHLRDSLALGDIGIIERQQAPKLADFLEGRFLDHIRLKSRTKPRTIEFYENGVRRLIEWDEWKETRLNLIDANLIEKFIQWRSKQPKRSHGEGVASVVVINSQLKTIRRALRFARDLGLIAKYPTIRCLPGENEREYVLTGKIENAYLSRCPSPLKEAAILMLDLGLRPDECVRVKKVDIGGSSLTVQRGKTKAARRTIPLLKRTQRTIDFLCASWPDSEWLFQGRFKGQHYSSKTLAHTHCELRSKLIDEEGEPLFSEEFILYSLRHTFGTRLGERCGNPYYVQALMGHANIGESMRYVHVSRAQIEQAMRDKEEYDEMLRGEKSPVTFPVG